VLLFGHRGPVAAAAAVGAGSGLSGAAVWTQGPCASSSCSVDVLLGIGPAAARLLELLMLQRESVWQRERWGCRLLREVVQCSYYSVGNPYHTNS
jgi:hypothetical protein